MARDRWKQSTEADTSAPHSDGGNAGGSGPVPDFLKRALTAGFSGFFLTGEALREALGDSVPKDWADFASDQSNRARSELFERLSAEIGRAIDKIDWATVLATLLEGRTLEVKAQVRLGESEAGSERVKLEFSADE